MIVVVAVAVAVAWKTPVVAALAEAVWPAQASGQAQTHWGILCHAPGYAPAPRSGTCRLSRICVHAAMVLRSASIYVSSTPSQVAAFSRMCPGHSPSRPQSSGYVSNRPLQCLVVVAAAAVAVETVGSLATSWMAKKKMTMIMTMLMMMKRRPFVVEAEAVEPVAAGRCQKNKSCLPTSS